MGYEIFMGFSPEALKEAVRGWIDTHPVVLVSSSVSVTYRPQEGHKPSAMLYVQSIFYQPYTAIGPSHTKDVSHVQQ